MAAQTQKSKLKNQNLATSPKSSKVPSTMEELLAQTGYQPHGIKKGEQVIGTITALSPKEILIDVGAKTEGVVLEKDKKLLSELLSTLHVGDKVSAMVLSAESEQGNPVLSLRRQLMDKNWGELLDKKEKGEQVEAVGVELTRGGLLVDVLGLRGFIPLSNLDQSVTPESPTDPNEIGRA